MNEIDRAEYKQALNAYLIPSGLFVACLLGAAGIFLVREGYGLGWVFMTASTAVIVWAFAAFITFQNKFRSKGITAGRTGTSADPAECDTGIETVSGEASPGSVPDDAGAS
jgi:hypothetical protein